MTALNGRTPGVLSAGQYGPGTRLSVMEQPVDVSLSYSDQHKEEAHSHGFFFLAVASAMWDHSSLTRDGTCTACSGSVRS